ncbi:MAG: Crp/Fnr family transcriptional regulator [Proteobacteria bacterium]|nr:Crp/Fnr family transcriptional regulator [Pseudomonadota bacterium]
MLDLVQETDLLRKIPMFAKLNASKLKLLAFTSELVIYEDGEVIFFAGDQADCAYVIMEGSVDVVTETDTGTLVALTLEQNQLFGELALLSNAPRSATLKASGKVTVMKITEEMFLKLVCENADLALDVMRQLSDKLAKSHHQVEDLQRQLEQQNSAT